jgi:adenosylcobinamide-GDP ribazoletransferase
MDELASMNVLSRFWLAASCVTCLPLGHLHKEQQDLSGLSKYLPAVGVLIAIALEVVVFVCDKFSVPHLVTGAVLTLVWLVMSGCIHLDGLMDTADGIFSHRSPERMLEIMHDSRVGNFGVITGVMAMVIKVTTLASAPFLTLQLAVLLVPVWARWAETFAIGYFPYLREQGMGKVWHDTTKFPRDIILAMLIPVLVTAGTCFIFNWRAALFMAAATALVGMISSFRIAAVLRGHTGDTYGAVVELSEAGALLLAAMFLPYWRV